MGVTCGQRGTAERRDKVGVTVGVGVRQQLKEGPSVRKRNTEGDGGQTDPESRKKLRVNGGGGQHLVCQEDGGCSLW